MLRSLLWGAIGALALTPPVLADGFAEATIPFVLSATQETHRYGLWLTAPADGRRTVRYVVASDDARLGFSPPLRPGEGALIGIGRGFAQGDHALDIICLGCATLPSEARRVILGRASPDHSGLLR